MRSTGSASDSGPRIHARSTVLVRARAIARGMRRRVAHVALRGQLGPVDEARTGAWDEGR